MNLNYSLPELLKELDSKGITGAKRYEEVKMFLGMKGRNSRTPVSGTF